MNQSANNSLVRWAEWFFGLGNTADAGHDAAFEHTWPWPAWATVLLVGFALALVIYLYAHERTTRGVWIRALLAGIRSVLILLVVFMLFGWMLRPFRTDLPDLVIALDVSQSMSLVDAFDSAERTSKLRARVASLGFPEATRLALAKSLLLENKGNLLTELESRYNVRYYLVGASTRSVEWDGAQGRDELRAATASDPSSRLGQGVRDILEAQRGRPTAALVLFTDGVTTAGRTVAESAAYARARHVQLFTVGIGAEKPPRNLRLSDLVADEMAFAGDRLNFDFRLTGTGFSGETVKVKLKKQGGTEILDEKSITLGPSGQAQSESLGHRPTDAGPIDYELTVEPQPGETDTADNVLRQRVTVANPSIKVLLVQGYPSFEFRYLKNLLQRELKLGAKQNEKAFELTTILQEADPQWTDATARNVFPVSREELFTYNVVIFGDVDPSFLGEAGAAAGSNAALTNLADFVKRRGGGVVFIAGARHTPVAYASTPLADLFPFAANSVALPDTRANLSTPLVVRPTPLGLTTPAMQLRDSPGESLATWQKLPGMYWLAELNEIKPGVRVLAEHPEKTNAEGRHFPVILLHYVGAGKVVFHASDETWRWRYRVGDAFFSRYWVQTLRQLARSTVFDQEAGARILADRKQYRLGEPVRLRVQFLDERKAPPADDGVTVVLEQQNGQTRRITLRREAANRGMFEGTVSNITEGNYHAWMAAPTLAGTAPAVDFRVEPPLGELAAREMDAADLRKAAEETGGKFYTLDTSGSLRDDLPAGRQVRIESLPPVSIWNSWKLSTLFVLLLLAEWIGRKWAGMV